MDSGTRAAALLTTALITVTVAAVPGQATSGRGGSEATAVNRPVRDNMFPGKGDTVVDALHYDLHLRWHRATRTLVASEVLRFRAARSARRFNLDLASTLRVTRVSLDGRSVRVSRRGDHKIVFHRAVHRGSRHTLRLSYRGRPVPTWLRSTRVGGERMPLGWMTNDRGEAYTAQDEPFGAFTWYAVNDQPSDKALYDFHIVAPKHWVGVANGVLLSRTKRHSRTVTHWHLSTPASSYLTTVGIGPYKETVDRRVKGLPITYWTPRSEPWTLRKVRYAAKAVTWLQRRVGRFPFPSLGILVAPEGGMETQTMITLGRDKYTLSKDTIVHEIAHQWFGDEVSPLRWHDGWLNEGWATYLAEATWSSHGSKRLLKYTLRFWDMLAPILRRVGGPPARPHKYSAFDSNIYYIPALMWDLVRRKVGDRVFWRTAAAWPRAHRFGSANYASAVRWWSRRTGHDLEPLFHRWLLGRKQPHWSPHPGSQRLGTRADARLAMPRLPDGPK